MILRMLWRGARCCNTHRPCSRRRVRLAMDHAAWRSQRSGRNQKIIWTDGAWRITEVR